MLLPHEKDALIQHLQHGAPLSAAMQQALFCMACAPLPHGQESTPPCTQAACPSSAEHAPVLVEAYSQKTAATQELSAVASSQQLPCPGLPNLLWQGDNLPLLHGLATPAGQAWLAARGGLRFIYIDPPFNVGSNFFAQTPVGEAASGHAPLRQKAYADTWAPGAFYAMLAQRLHLAHSLLAPEGTLVLHCDWRTSARVRLMLDTIFGEDHFLGEIIWHYTGGGRATRYFSRKHDTLFHYAKTKHWYFTPDAVRVPYAPTSGYAKKGIVSKAGKQYTPHPQGTPPDDVWRIPIINPLAAERLGYPTQKPEALLERLLLACTRPGDLVADFFCGSGTTLAVAQRLGRAWLGADQSPLAIATSQERLAQPQLAQLEGQQQTSAPSAFCLATLANQQHSPTLPPLFSPDARRPEQFTTNMTNTHTLGLSVSTSPQGVQVTLTQLHALLPPEAEQRDEPALEGGLHWAYAWAVAFVPAPAPIVPERTQVARTGTPATSEHSLTLPAFPFPTALFTPAWHTCRHGKARTLALQTPVLALPEKHCTLLVRVTDVRGGRVYTSLPLFPSSARASWTCTGS
ncbi:DNA-methyltransferase [Desulfovibrio cuneatus]|uniref:DNA-methyltransferase n=1 Tax=Desulfovibrio cuneatus TaxID=159728 RepID=UPI00040BA41D|nr:site-specific DNA-methyltransferase [Desulfovibrio cuneatus]